VQAALPLALDVGLLFLSEAADALVAPLGREVAIEPAADFLSEPFLVRREAEIHDSDVSKSGILEAWHQKYFAAAAAR
jgi:hypothetical protein